MKLTIKAIIVIFVTYRRQLTHFVVFHFFSSFAPPPCRLREQEQQWVFKMSKYNVKKDSKQQGGAASNELMHEFLNGHLVIVFRQCFRKSFITKVFACRPFPVPLRLLRMPAAGKYYSAFIVRRSVTETFAAFFPDGASSGLHVHVTNSCRH